MMSKISTHVLLATLLAGSLNVTLGQEAPRANPQFQAATTQIKVFQPVIGKWFMDDFVAPMDYPDSGIKKGDSFRRTMTFSWDVVSSIVVGEIRLENTSGKYLVVMKSVAGWDAAAGKIVGKEFWVGQFGTWYAGDQEWSVKGDSLVLISTGSTDKDTTCNCSDLYP
jgi:hypothetical protein